MAKELAAMCTRGEQAEEIFRRIAADEASWQLAYRLGRGTGYRDGFVAGAECQAEWTRVDRAVLDDDVPAAVRAARAQLDEELRLFWEWKARRSA